MIDPTVLLAVFFSLIILITKNKANSLDPDQTRQTLVPDLDINSLTLIVVDFCLYILYAVFFSLNVLITKFKANSLDPDQT